MSNEILSGHLAVAALLIINLNLGGPLMVWGALMAPLAWWLAQLVEAEVVPRTPGYLAAVASQFFAVAAAITGA